MTHPHCATRMTFIPMWPGALQTLSALLDLADQTIVVDTGDFSEGHPFYSQFRGEPERRLMASYMT